MDIKKIFISVIIILAIYKVARGEDYKNFWQESNWTASELNKRYDFDEPEICIPCIITIESNGNPNVVSKKGCVGLMQVSEAVIKEYAHYNNESYYEIMSHIFWPDINVTVGTWYINKRIPQMLRAYGLEDTIEARLFCYNAGIGNYIKYKQGKIKMPNVTWRYIKKYFALAKGE